LAFSADQQSEESDPVKLVIIGKSNWTYDILDFLTRVESGENEEPIKSIAVNKIHYSTGVKLGHLEHTFNVFETYAATVCSQVLSYI